MNDLALEVTPSLTSSKREGNGTPLSSSPASASMFRAGSPNRIWRKGGMRVRETPLREAKIVVQTKSRTTFFQ